MRIRLIKRKTIENFAVDNPRSRASIKVWLTQVKQADWESPGDIIKTFSSADLLGNSSNRVIFNIAGNHYRMICKFYFGASMIHLFIKWMGTYNEYTSICRRNEQYTINIY